MPRRESPYAPPKTADDLRAEAVVRVTAVRDSFVTIEATGGHIMMNEVGYVTVAGDPPDDRGRRPELKAEVLRVRGREADMQVFESTQGVTVGDPVRLTGRMLSVSLGPGLLGKVFDGLQNPLASLARDHGFFLPRGMYPPPLDRAVKWQFTPSVGIGTRLLAGDTVGTVQEGRFPHKIMVPFDTIGPVQVTWIQEGPFSIDTVVARIAPVRADGSVAEAQERPVTLAQPWAVRRPLPDALLRSRRAERLYPDRPLTTTLRLIDTFFPIALGGTACIPGPFGAGKTVLQGLIARYSTADIVVIVACGERAGEVVETIEEFPQLRDPRTGGSLMDRTVIVCNTSSMPVAARESSIYTGITIGEYYRQMGYNTLVIADSTSRWAQAMRETSGRMEEIPGEEAFPAYLDSAIKSVYERAGVIRAPDGAVGSLTMIGTVSPAGGNFEEPVTQATLSTVKAFLGLSADRAYRRAYPAVDPLISWSRYRAQLAEWAAEALGPGWNARVDRLQHLLEEGDRIQQMMQVTGEEGVTLDDFVTFEKARLVDLVYLQQDAFDPVDVSMSLERQKKSFGLLADLVERDYRFADKDQARDAFTKLTAAYRNLNYTAPTAAEEPFDITAEALVARVTGTAPAEAA